MNLLPTIILVPFVAGIVCFLLSEKRRGVRKLIVFLVAGYCLLSAAREFFRFPEDLQTFAYFHMRFFLILASAFIGFLIAIYSERFTASSEEGRMYDACLLFALGSAFAVFLAGALYDLLLFWGILGAVMYLLIASGGSPASGAAKKTFIIVGGSDAFLLVGIVLYAHCTGGWYFPAAPVAVADWPKALSFLCFLVAAFAKMGAVPFHSWLPDAAQKAPLPAAAFLPAAIDKLAGVYLLFLTCRVLFSPGPVFSLILLAAGSLTIILAVLFALGQHDAKKLLGWHAVSQAGYMVLGIGTGTAAGILGALFHMLNNAIYKQSLFLSVGAVEKKRGTTDLDSLGGLAKAMPITFLAFLVPALAISGVPPLNGFMSKWMIYQGVIEMRGMAGVGAKLWPLWLIAAMFGSALTLASFMKLLHAIFLGVRPSGSPAERDEVSWPLWLPSAVLSLLCVVLGLAASPAFLEKIFGSVGGWVPRPSGGPIIGSFRPDLAALLLVGSGLIGWLIYRMGASSKIREDVPFIGGEKALPDDARVTGTGFYATLSEMPLVGGLLKREAFCDLYAGARAATLSLSALLSRLHTGVLPWYMSWALAALIILLLVMIGKY
jgi:formate hydrogenlyase subunit 3/multisubunit Na+/H+ antiporter MnhD subunit